MGDYFGDISGLEKARAERRAAVQKWSSEMLAEADRALTGGVYAEDWWAIEDEDVVIEPEVQEAEEVQFEPVAVEDEPVVEPEPEPVEPEVEAPKAPKATSKRATTSK